MARFPAQQEARTHLHASTHISMGCVDVCVCVCVLETPAAPSSSPQPLMNTLIMLKSAPCLGFPVPSGKVNSGWLHSTARACGRAGAQRLWRSAVTVLDVSGPKIDLGMQSKYHGNIKAPGLMPQNKQTSQVKPRQRSQITCFPHRSQLL